jgi:hypothetical protein
LYFTVWFGIPVWFSFRGYVHLMDVFAMKKSGERLERIFRFARDYLGFQGVDSSALPGTVYIPLKASRTLKWMAAYYWLLWIAGLAAMLAVIDTAATWNAGRALKPGEDSFLAVGWTGFAVFVPGLLLYHVIRRPSRRQANIRAVVARCLGPHSDPAGWQSSLLTRVVTAHGLPGTSSAMLQAAERKAASKEYEEALLLARLAVGLADAQDEFTCRRAESTTDECLQRWADEVRLAGHHFEDQRGNRATAFTSAAASAAAGPGRRDRAPAASETAVELLCSLIAARRTMVVNKVGSDVLWSDGAMFEIGGRFPPRLQRMISAPTRRHDARPYLAALQASLNAEWSPAAVDAQTRSDGQARGVDVRSSRGATRVRIDPIYLDYLLYRFPAAGLFVRGDRDPVLFVAEGRIKAAVMPLAPRGRGEG